MYEIIAEKREQARLERQALADQRREQWQAEKRRGEGVQALVAISLEALGFRRWWRHQWRRRRNMKALTFDGPPTALPSWTELRQLVERVKNGEDESAG